MRDIRPTILFSLVLLLSGCATLAQGVVPPRFEVVADRPAELRPLPPSREHPLGALAIRLWAHVENPNPYGLTLTRLRGDLLLEGARAAQVDFPLGVPLPAVQDTIIPLDVVIDPADVPGLGGVVSQAIAGEPVGYSLVGRFTVDAGLLGRPTFGPRTLLEGRVQTRR